MSVRIQQTFACDICGHTDMLEQTVPHGSVGQIISGPEGIIAFSRGSRIDLCTDCYGLMTAAYWRLKRERSDVSGV